ncbi:MAG: alkaline phosphatase family protein, partial [Clostridia bacterium]|nr:alkaline phosphatase family protein [Clostridia bacterium]
MKKRLCMISLDAASHEDAEQLFALPNLRALQQGSLFCSRVNTIYPTITYPIHVSLITGCYPNKHGIPHNQPL